ncbi:MAG: P-type conjugative transfer ATPase TrbB [Fusobacterium gastrosuis]|uniref:P-type conjugative transfer ATPase TrbB n=1 Tax=Fusobacterium TaxID=848 RepID=UPI0025C332BE|nr:P-type conjugative transfer ATPase TrbB [Fusobacterium sp.]MCI7224329.1 P-type conjugative transfer ATPase TrbB [Fusobacterium sp.]MDY5794717.1 P-type conjugative transfer ATPase TrbB [Fusobacterium gastrosuis]
MSDLNYREAKTLVEDRLIRLLKFSLGEIVPYLEDDDVIEVMLNPDKTLWIDTLSKGMYFSGHIIEPEVATRVIQTVATHMNRIIDYKCPILSAELPESQSRFEGLIPPIVKNPIFTIRKKGIKIFSLDDYIDAGTLTKEQKEIIVNGVREKQNILVVGATSTGKTTFTNAIVNEIPENERVVILQDTDEIQTNLKNVVFLKTSDFTNMNDLLKTTLRLRPDRIIVGEVRDEAALALLTAWNTGHQGFCTIHSHTALGGLKQLELYILRASKNKQEELISMTVNLIVVLKRTKDKDGKIIRKVDNISTIEAFENNKYVIKKIA